MAEINHSVLEAYFKQIAANLKGINDYFRMDLTEITGAFRSSANFPCLLAESHESDLGDSSIQQTINNRTFAFTVYFKPAKKDYDDQNLKLTESEIFGYKIIARMKHDSTIKGHFLYNHFKVENVTNHKVGPVFNEKLYGYRFVGSIKAHQPLKVNPADWEDNPTICQ